jgi:hypothetical protein
VVLYIPLFLLHRGTIKLGTKWYSPKADLIATHESEMEETHGGYRAGSPESGHSANRRNVYAEEQSRELLNNPEVLS